MTNDGNKLQPRLEEQVFRDGEKKTGKLEPEIQSEEERRNKILGTPGITPEIFKELESRYIRPNRERE